MDGKYTTEKTIAFFSIGDEYYVTKELARAIAADLLYNLALTTFTISFTILQWLSTN